MNYTYLPSSPYSASPVIVMTTNPSSKKMTNLASNPNVSLLVHDWVSHRPPTSHTRRLSGPGPGNGNGNSGRGSSSSPGPPRMPAPPEGSLASLLLNLNTSAVSSISATINGAARLAARGSDEESFYRARHLENNTFDAEGPLLFGGGAGEGDDEVPPRHRSGAGGSGAGGERFGSGGEEDVRVIVVGVKDVRISDWKGAVRDWVIVPPRGGGGGQVPNGLG